MFEQLSREAIFRIIDIELAGFHRRLLDLGYKLTLSDEAKNFIAEQGYDPQYGARPLKRAIQRYLEDELADLILSSGLEAGNEVVMDFDAEAKKIVPTVKTDTPAAD